MHNTASKVLSSNGRRALASAVMKCADAFRPDETARRDAVATPLSLASMPVTRLDEQRHLIADLEGEFVNGLRRDDGRHPRRHRDLELDQRHDVAALNRNHFPLNLILGPGLHLRPPVEQ